VSGLASEWSDAFGNPSASTSNAEIPLYMVDKEADLLNVLSLASSQLLFVMPKGFHFKALLK
jgi:hypothetical protein